MSKENNKVDINKHEIDIGTLFKQNVNDLSAIKELYRKLQDMEYKISQIKYIDSNLANKLKKDYENLKKDYESLKKAISEDYESLKCVILDENIQAKLSNDIEAINSQLETKVKQTDLYNSFKNSLSPYNQAKAVITFVDDDGKSGFLTNLKPLLDIKGWKCSLGVITSNVGKSNYLTIEQLKLLQSDGFDIMSHSKTHSEAIFTNLSNVSDVDLINEMKESQEWLINNGFNGYDTFVYPWGNFGNDSIRVKKIARMFYKYALNSFTSYNIQPCDNMYLDRYFVNKKKDLSSVKSIIDEAINNGAWLIIGTHSYTTSEWDTNYFTELFDYIDSKDVLVLPFSEAEKYKGNVLSVGEYTSNSKIFIGKNGSNTFPYQVINNATTYDETSIITKFPVNTKTSFISVANSFNVAGVIEVFRSSAKHYSYATFIPYNSNTLYMRKWNDTTNIWDSWTQIGSGNTSTTPETTDCGLNVIKGAYDGTMDDSITLFTKFKETVVHIINTKDTVSNVGGTMKVYHGETYYSYATFININGDFYIRKWTGADSSGAWGDWKKISINLT